MLFVPIAININMDQAKRSRKKAIGEENQISKNVFTVAPGVWRMKDIFVNVFIIQDTEGTNWVLVDAGLKTSASKIKNMVTEIFGSTSRPASIILTHGHFDHIGSLKKLVDEWGIPVYAHKMELPFLNGNSEYPPADPSVGGGMMSALSFLYPNKPINVEEHLRELPEDGNVPDLSEWKYFHTPGHAPGHISLFRESDKLLIAGDAVVSTKQESVISVITQKKALHGPPKYFTADWGAAARSVKELAALKPDIIATGHGQTLYGPETKKQLNQLSKSFWQLGMPTKGRYVREPALFNENGVTYIPPTRGKVWIRVAGATILLVAGFLLYRNRQKKIGSALMAGSLRVLTGRLPAI
jgi:glyoxylase-like metal-dependent hydrolase (beta-lactamase superfamily II)